MEKLKRIAALLAVVVMIACAVLALDYAVCDDVACKVSGK